MATSTLITGNTFPVKDQIKALGGRWDPDAKGWRVPAAKAAEAQALVDGAPKQSYQPTRSSGGSGRVRTSSGGYYGRRTGCSCGSIEGQIRKTDCWSCRHDAE